MICVSYRTPLISAVLLLTGVKVKPNLGHSEPASAMAQIMKSILALEHGLIPATIGIKRFNPGIDFEGAKVKVVTEMTPWPSGLLRRVSINRYDSFLHHIYICVLSLL